MVVKNITEANDDKQLTKAVVAYVGLLPSTLEVTVSKISRQENSSEQNGVKTQIVNRHIEGNKTDKRNVCFCVAVRQRGFDL